VKAELRGSVVVSRKRRSVASEQRKKSAEVESVDNHLLVFYLYNCMLMFSVSKLYEIVE